MIKCRWRHETPPVYDRLFTIIHPQTEEESTMKTVESKEEYTAESLAQAAGERAKSCVDAGVNALNAVSGKARQIGQNADGYVRDSPWLAIGAAAGVGAVIGFLLGRRGNS
jgi:ElaB/YqjD/DUF883 family membrane-anchored ribosome-binding protein